MGIPAGPLIAPETGRPWRPRRPWPAIHRVRERIMGCSFSMSNHLERSETGGSGVRYSPPIEPRRLSPPVMTCENSRRSPQHIFPGDRGAGFLAARNGGRRRALAGTYDVPGGGWPDAEPPRRPELIGEVR